MEREAVSPSPLSIITMWDRHGMTSLSISHVCVSREEDPSTMFGTEEETTKKKKKSTRNFSNHRNKLLAVRSSPGKDS